MTSASHKTRPAFTLIEMLACLALAGMLMAVLLSVTASVRRGYALLREQSDAGAALGDGGRVLLETLHHDLVHAGTIETSHGGVRLTGFGELDPRTFEPTHELAVVRYRLARVGERSCFLREQLNLNQMNNRAARTNLIATDVAGFEMNISTDKSERQAVAWVAVHWSDERRSSLEARWLIR